MELSLAFIAVKLGKVFPITLLAPDGSAFDLESVRTCPKLPRFSSARIVAQADAATLDHNTLPIVDATDASFATARNNSDNASVLTAAPHTPHTSSPISQNATAACAWIGQRRPARGNYVAWIQSDQVNAVDVLNAALDLFNDFNDWNMRVRDALLRHESVVNIMRALENVTDNPYWLADPAMRPRMMSDDRGMSEFSENWRYQRQNGASPIGVIDELVKSGDLERLNEPSQAWLFENCSSYSLPFVTKTLFLNDEVYAYLFIIQLNADSLICDLELAETLGTLVADYVWHSGFSPSDRRRYAEQLLRTCIAGGDLSERQLEDLLGLLGWKQSPGFMVAVFDRQSHRVTDEEVPQVQVELLRDRMGIGIAFSHGSLLVYIADTSTVCADEMHEKVMQTCEMLGWKAGVSNEFSDINQLGDYYRQAHVALQTGKTLAPDEPVYDYQKYSLAFLCLTMAHDLDRALFMHPDAERLIAYDENAKSELAATLTSYLSNERNISRTAQDLKLHRNSIIYRIDKIESLLETNLDNPGNRMALLLSLKAWALKTNQS